MKPLWLIGEDIARSPSPALHNAALAALGLPAAYALHPTARATLSQALDDAERECAGVNITAPHKLEAAARYRDIADDESRGAGAINTVVMRDGRAVAARNTDIGGLLTAWRRANVPVEGRVVAIHGAGGAARAAVVAAHQGGAKVLRIFARRPDAAAGLAAFATSIGIEAEVGGAADASLCVNAASAVDDPEALLRATLPGAGFVHDLRYGARTHALRDAALRSRLLFQDGLLMLVSQAQLSLELFLGIDRLPEDARRAMERAAAAFAAQRG